MKIYDPSNPDDVKACIAEVDAYLESHRIDPYTPDEIAALSGQRIAEVKLPAKLPYTAPCITRRAKYHGLV